MSKGGGQQQSQGGGGGGDNSLDFLWVVVAFIIGIMLTWHYGKGHITQGICFVRFYEIEAIKYAIFHWARFAVWLSGFGILLPVPDLSLLGIWQNFTVTNRSPVQFSILMELSSSVGSYLRYPVIFILAVLTSFIYFSNTAQRFKSFLNMKQLKTLEQENWPQIAPVVKLDLLNTDLDKGPWAMSLSPMKYCKKHNLLREEKNEYGSPVAFLKRGDAYRHLSLQLGPRWRGPEFLPKHQRALYAVFASRINGDKPSADALLIQLSISAARGRMNFKGVGKLVAKHKRANSVLKITSVHAYTTTALASLLSASREAGVLATAEFIWLKPIDRRMWYMLNSVGRPTAVSEISGAFSHWVAEKKLGLPLVTPMVEQAVTGFELALKDIIYKPDEKTGK